MCGCTIVCSADLYVLYGVCAVCKCFLSFDKAKRSLSLTLSCASLFSCFFFKQKTSYDMRISDWSSDVCSSDLRTAGVEPGGARAGRLSLLFRPWLSGDRRVEAPRLSRCRTALYFRHRGQDAAAVAENPRRSDRAQAGRRDGRLLGELRAQRPAAGEGSARLARLFGQRRFSPYRRGAEGRAQSAPRYRGAPRGGDVPPPRGGRHTVELERRRYLAAAAAKGRGVPMIDGSMQSYGLTLDKFL